MRPITARLTTVALIGIAAATLWADPPTKPPSFRVAGYLPDYRLADFDPSSTTGLTDLILFSAELSEDGSLDLTRLTDCPWPRLTALQTQHRVRLILTIGGWGRSEHFATVAASPERRRRCAEALVRLARKRHLDGFDLDWEHPNDPSQENDYGTLIRELSEALGRQKRTLSVTIAPWQRIPDEAVEAADGIQVMAYDYPGEHSPLERVRDDVAALIDRGIPADKMVLGLPFYGRDIKTRKAMTYQQIAARHDPAPSVDRIGDLSFNGRRTIHRKVKLAMDLKLKGVMVWELGQDSPPGRSLLGTINQAVKSRPR